MTPHCSASGMNSAGETMPRSGWCQRSSASAPSISKPLQIEDRLEIELELLAGDRLAQLGLGAAARLHARVQLLLVEHVRPAAQLLHAAHGECRVLDELVGGVAVIGADGDADAGAELQTLAAGEERLADEIDDLPRTCRRRPRP